MSVSMLMSASGIDVLAGTLAQARELAQKFQKDWYTASAVTYGVYHELGTENMPARPHWRPAIRQLEAEIAFESEDIFRDLLGGKGFAEILALRLERLVKIHITRQHVLQTGNYRGSVTTGPTPAAVTARSESMRTDR